MFGKRNDISNECLYKDKQSVYKPVDNDDFLALDLEANSERYSDQDADK